MEREKDISEELRRISPVVDSIGRVPPYEVPVGFFDGFPMAVVAMVNLIKAEQRLGQLRGLPTYSIPEDYFDGFAQKILARIKAGAAQNAQSEQTQSSPSEQTQSAQSELEQLSPLLSKMGRKMPFQAPEGYFSELLTNVVSGVKAIEFVNDELEHPVEGLSALATPGLKDRPAYQAPEGYFENLPAAILARIQQPAGASAPASSSASTTRPETAASPAPARIVSMYGRKNWWKYSAAAAVAGLILTIGWLGIFNKHAVTIGGNDINLSKVSDQEIENYLDNHNVPVAESVTNSTVNLDISEGDIKNMLGDVSDAELRQYLDEHVGSRDPATN